MNVVLAAGIAILLELETLGGELLVLRLAIVLPLAFGELKGDDLRGMLAPAFYT